MEQFAYPLKGPPNDRKGDISMVLLQKVRLTNLGDVDLVIPVSMTHNAPFRYRPEQASRR